MSHIPVNHPLRPLYRAIATLVGIYLVVFGLVGVIASAGTDAFSRSDITSLGLHTNLAFSVVSLVAGAVVLVAVFIGRGVYYMLGLWGGPAFMVVGFAMLALLNTDLNVLNFSVGTVIVSFIVGLLLFSAGVYGRSGTAAVARAEESVRHGGH